MIYEYLTFMINSLHTQIAPNILEVVGQTPITELRRLFPDQDLRIYGKLEFMNPGGSIKDRTATQLLQHALQQGILNEGDTVVESSSGNMAIGLAQACKFLGLRLIAVVDPLLNKHTEKILRAFDVKIDQVVPNDQGETLLTLRLRRVQQLLKSIPNSFWPNQYANVENPRAHLQTMKEIHLALDAELDYLFVAASTCGTLMGCAQYISDNRLSTRLIAVDAVGSVLFGHPKGIRKIPGHGAGRPSQFLDSALLHDVVHVTDLECVAGCHRLLNQEALLCGGSSGAVISAIQKYSNQLPPGARCGVILCDRGERYLDTIYNENWVSKELEITHNNANLTIKAA